MREKAIRTKRAALSIGEQTERLTRNRDASVSSDSISEAIINFGLVVASEKVTNGLRAAGLGLEDGTVDAESIRAALSSKIGAEISELSPEGIAEALNARLSREVADSLGVEGLDLLNGGDLIEQARALAIQAVAGGRASGLVSASLMRELRSAAAYMAAGVEPSQREAAKNREKQRRHRIIYKQVWQ